MVLLIVASLTWAIVYDRRHKKFPLLTAGIAVDAAGNRIALLPGRPVDLLDDSRVIASPSAHRQVLLQRRWLASGDVPGSSGAFAGMVRDALLDLHLLTEDNGALLGSWPTYWHYVWPRDASFAAVALAHTGHWADAVAILMFLQRIQPPSGVFQARYLESGLGPPDSRGEQSDGLGWALWATAETVAGSPSAQRATVLHRLEPMIRLSTETALRLTQGSSGFPPSSQDYWEVRPDRLSLGVAAPMALALGTASRLQGMLGNSSLAKAAAARAAKLRQAISDGFGPVYPRYLGGSQQDSATTFLLPPFVGSADPSVVAAWRRVMADTRRPGGGFAPGEGWAQDGVSWTPTTSLFALTASSLGDRQTATALLTWLDAHRTGYGSLPEKVLSNGQPAGPAPLAWTSAVVVLAVEALDASPG